MSAHRRSSGVLGRGPAFWAVMVFVSTSILVLLGTTKAIEHKSLLILLTAIPCGLAVVMFRAGYNTASGPNDECSPVGTAQQRYIKRTAVSTSLYLVFFAVLMLAEREWDVAQPVKVALSVLPGLAIIGVFWAIARLIVEESDEFMRMLVVRQALIASGFALSAASIWGFMESANVVPHIDAYYWAVAFFFGLFIGAAANRIEHGTWGTV